jgi:hypothetical protein
VVDPLRLLVLVPAPVHPSVVAFPEAGVVLDGDGAPLERDPGRLDGTGEVRDVGSSEPIVPAPRAKLRGGLAAARRELAGQPAGRDAGLVVGRDRVGLVDELEGHAGSVARTGALPIEHARD